MLKSATLGGYMKTDKQKKLLSEDKLEKLEILAFENCLGLHKDSITLFKK